MGGFFSAPSKPKPPPPPPPKVIPPTPIAPTAVEDKRSIAKSQNEKSKRRQILSSRGGATTGASTGRSLLG